MHRMGLIELPAPTRPCPQPKIVITDASDPQTPISQPLHRLPRPQFTLISTRRDARLWNEYIERYHDLGYQGLARAQLRYFAIIDGQIAAALGFGAAWKTAPRDQYIGWNPRQREANLHLIVNQADVNQADI